MEDPKRSVEGVDAHALARFAYALGAGVIAFEFQKKRRPAARKRGGKLVEPERLARGDVGFQRKGAAFHDGGIENGAALPKRRKELAHRLFGRGEGKAQDGLQEHAPRIAEAVVDAHRGRDEKVERMGVLRVVFAVQL